MAISITRDDARFANLKRARNARWPLNPADGVGNVTLCLSSEDTAEALQRVISAGQRPTIRSGGHCYEDFYANNPNGTLIDLSLMNHVGDLPHDSRYHLGPGATLGKAYQ
jgi:FAD/FMN-containing dehydrogenase